MNLKRAARELAKSAARQTIGRVPPPAARLTGSLAVSGGRPVRDVRFRPWPKYPAPTQLAWARGVGAQLKQVFLSGIEGLPQPLAQEFARQWAAYCGCRFALLLPHGTDALRIALAAALDHDGLDYGGEVIVPNLSFIASATTALDRRLGVALVDVDPDTLNLDPQRVVEAIVPGRTRAIMAVHLFGQPADMTALRAIARQHSLALIEDAAQAHGARHTDGPAGALGDVAGFSFQSTKNLAAGEGGALTTNDPAIYERAYSFHNVGRDRLGGERWGHNALGYNCRPSEYVAALLLERLRSLEAQQACRAERFRTLRELLSESPCVQPLGDGPGVTRHGVYMFTMRYQPARCGGLTVEDFLRAVQAEGVPLQRGYARTLAQQPALQSVAQRHPELVRALPTPVADAAVQHLIFLPHNLFLGSLADMREIAAALYKVQSHYAPAAVHGARLPAASPAPATAVTVGVSAPSKTIRFGIVGIGTMGQLHAEIIAANPRCQLSAVADADPVRARDQASARGCRSFASPEEMFCSGAVDAVVIATPHWQHAELTIAALEAGLHVLCEKPLAVTVRQADAMLAAAARGPGRLVVVHQYRWQPAFQFAKTTLRSGELGAVYRCAMTDTAWRTAAYYQSAAWRGTWRGEGGGVVLNQAPHLLDRYAWLCGVPQAVTAVCDTRLHRIEVEDTVSALMHHADGLHGYLHLDTIECPALSRTELACDRGRLVIENGKVWLTKLADSIRERTDIEQRATAMIGSETRLLEFPQPDIRAMLRAFYDDIAPALADNHPPDCTGADGAHVVEMANAILLSAFTRATVALPVDRARYEQFIADRINQAARPA